MIGVKSSWVGDSAYLKFIFESSPAEMVEENDGRGIDIDEEPRVFGISDIDVEGWE